ncbi:uncharacterized protein [Ambystoma mexicanum]|uniref:uncharacterized protein isoform X3 n=1 Tax=Ambystoma mexicanum TaxID=8296 RepID=UPI0037E901A4
MMPVTMHDFADFFFEEEWKVLHEWQKELYMNVMKEIHQALSSLGPLIAATVSSLRAREKEELLPAVNPGSERRPTVDHVSGPLLDSTVSSLRDSEEEELLPTVNLGSKRISSVLHVSDPLLDSSASLLRDSEEEVLLPTFNPGSKRIPSVLHVSGFSLPNAGLPWKNENALRSFWNAHSTAEMGENSTNPISGRLKRPHKFTIKEKEGTDCHDNKKRRTITSPKGITNLGHDVFSFTIKEEEETDCCDNKKRGTTTSPKGITNFEHEDFSFIIKEDEETDCPDNKTRGTIISPEGITNFEREEFSFIIKEDEETDCPDNKTRGTIISPKAGDGGMNRQKKVEASQTLTKQTQRYKASACRPNTKVAMSSGNSTNFRRQMWPERYQKQRGEKTAQCENGSNNSETFIYERAISPNYNGFQSYPSSSILQNDLQNTQRSMIYQCTECNETYNHKDELVRHMGEHSKTFRCSACGKTFIHKGSLIKHYRTHTGEKPFSCTFCSKSFTRKDYLNGHMRTHTGERPYKCTECEKTFTQKGEFNQHRRKHTRQDKH